MKVQRPKVQSIFCQKSGSWEKVRNLSLGTFQRTNYREIRTPSFENYEVFSRSSGETRRCSKEMYDFVTIRVVVTLHCVLERNSCSSCLCRK